MTLLVSVWQQQTLGPGLVRQECQIFPGPCHMCPIATNTASYQSAQIRQKHSQTMLNLKKKTIKLDVSKLLRSKRDTIWLLEAYAHIWWYIYMVSIHQDKHLTLNFHIFHCFQKVPRILIYLVNLMGQTFAQMRGVARQNKYIWNNFNIVEILYTNFSYFVRVKGFNLCTTYYWCLSVREWFKSILADPQHQLTKIGCPIIIKQGPWIFRKAKDKYSKLEDLFIMACSNCRSPDYKKSNRSNKNLERHYNRVVVWLVGCLQRWL